MLAKNKQKIIALLEKNNCINISWNCGGDETLVGFPNNDFITSYSDFAQEFGMITNLVIDKLSLPNAGSFHDEGEGKILLTEKGQVILTYSCKKYYEDWYYEQYAENAAFYKKFSPVFSGYNNSSIILKEKICNPTLYIKNGIIGIPDWFERIDPYIKNTEKIIENLTSTEAEDIELNENWKKIIANTLRNYLFFKDFDAKAFEELSAYDPTVIIHAEIADTLLTLKSVGIHAITDPVEQHFTDENIILF